MEGTVRPITAKIYDVGTHVLSGERGEILAYLSSTAVDLSLHVGERVAVDGMLMPLGSGADQLLSVRALRSIGAADPGVSALDEEVIREAKQLAASFDPPYLFAPTDPATVVSSSAQSGIAVVRIEQQLAVYLVKLVRKPDPVTGAWTVFAIEQGQADEVSSIPSPVPSSAPSSLPSAPSSLPSSTVPSSAVSSAPPSVSSVPATPVAVPSHPAAKSDEPSVAALVDALPSLLAQTSFSGAFLPTRVELTAEKLAYVVFSDGTTRGMVLVSWSDTPANGKVVATFVPGETTDWKKESGANSARDLPATIYTKSGGVWTKQATTEPGFALYRSAALKLSWQYPKQWYYGTVAAPEGMRARIGFSTKPVDEGPLSATVDLSSQSAEAVAGSLSGVAPATIGGKAGFRGVTEEGETVLIVPLEEGGSAVVRSATASAASLETIAATIAPIAP